MLAESNKDVGTFELSVAFELVITTFNKVTWLYNNGKKQSSPGWHRYVDCTSADNP